MIISSFDNELWRPEAPMTDQIAGRSGPLASSRPKSQLFDCEINWKEVAAATGSISPYDLSRELCYTLPADGTSAHRLSLDFLLVPKNSNRLLVVFHGALQREKYLLPRFEFRRSFENFDASLLFIGDPTLTVNERLGLGWYVGTEEDDAHAMIAELIRSVQRALSAGSVVLTGSSGGGFASLAIGHRIPQSTAVAFSPQTTIEKYYSRHRKELLDVAFPSWDTASLAKAAHRFDLSARYESCSDNSVIYLQNSSDRFHVVDHFIPFVKHVTKSNSDLGRFDFRCFSYGDGHRPPSKELLLEYTELGFTELEK